MANSNSLFLSALFLIFFLIFFILRRSRINKLVALCTANTVFYLLICPYYFPLIVAWACINYFTAIAISNAQSSKKFYLLYFHVGLAVACLVLFKIKSASSESWLFPLGLSYFTFQSISYIIDVTRGSTRPINGLANYYASFSFFPVLSSGPITHTAQISHQLDFETPLSQVELRAGVLRIANGMFKKTIADLIALSTSSFLAEKGHHSALAAWVLVFGLSSQYYADFSGYSDMAIGIARLLGFRVPENFHLPFLSISFADHYRRWHASLTEWMKNYFFFPFTLKLREIFPSIARVGRGRLVIAIATISTMSLIGLWHIFSWNYLIWGALNGILIFLSPPILRLTKKCFGAQAKLFDIASTLLLTSLLRLLTATRDSKLVLTTWNDLIRPSVPSLLTYRSCMTLFLVLGSLVVPHILDYYVQAKDDENRILSNTTIWWCLVIVLFVFATIIGLPLQPFQYTQF